MPVSEVECVPERNEASAKPADRVAQWSGGIFQKGSQAPRVSQVPPWYAERTLAGLGWHSNTLCRLLRLAAWTALLCWADVAPDSAQTCITKDSVARHRCSRRTLDVSVHLNPTI